MRFSSFCPRPLTFWGFCEKIIYKIGLNFWSKFTHSAKYFVKLMKWGGGNLKTGEDVG